ncbi:MAG: dihydroorotate dehydrogenase [Actinobacteria bacterium]|nr:dihydroorotate dehydrogenase [Actinomycetota bacterium]NDA94613.1 dihydroorotate dehydrogenase [Actinomycetota bacterium]NDH80448.1 dihydroorotate dehydrogenase [Actinomycetota bacterium]NDH98812.1 dihydroorotate dehydrogenase [Actinomycetota bacterium]NDI07407.1 dihydroorotate dehydrogenase [Actinomycetota bacterium]
MIDLSTTLGNAWFPSPLFTASGCASSGKELAQFIDLREIGAVVTKSVMSKARYGRPTPRMAETPSGMINSIGLQGPGIDEFLTHDLPWLVSQRARVIVSIAGETVEEYATLARKVRSAPGISALEVNISCPNVENRGLVFACDPDASRRVIDGVRKTLGGELPIIAKLSPDVTDLVSIAKGVVDAGADGLALINTVLSMVINLDTMRPHLGGKTGGLSGPAIRPIAVRAIYQVHEALPTVPILGMGGVASGRDALELILAGAKGVSVGTASFGDPAAIISIQNELKELLKIRGFTSVAQAVGFAHRPNEIEGA